MDASGPPYYDVARLQESLPQVLQAMVAPGLSIIRISRFPAGFSWLTFGVTAVQDQGTEVELILRLAPPHGLLPPYRAEKEFLALSSLTGTGIPIPEALAYSDDPSLLGASFLITRRVAGRAPAPWELKGAPQAMLGLAQQFVDGLARLHAFTWQDSAFAKYADGITPSNTASRQAQFWIGVADAAALRPNPIMVDAGHWLLHHAPAAPRLSIVHGDYRLGNFLAEQERLSAVLDWELVHIGDPHEDLGWALLPIYNGRSPKLFGAMEIRDVHARYQKSIDIEINEATLQWYTVFALFKTIGISMSGAAAYARRDLSDIRLAVLGSQTIPVLRLLLTMLEST